MKAVIFLFSFVLMACLFHGGKADCESIYDSGPKLKGEEFIKDCVRYTCLEDGAWGGIGCPLSACKVQIGWQEQDLSKPYPECCERPICKTEEN